MIVFVCGAIALGTLYGAFAAGERDLRIGFFLFFLFNATAVAVALIEGSPYAFSWMPPD